MSAHVIYQLCVTRFEADAYMLSCIRSERCHWVAFKESNLTLRSYGQSLHKSFDQTQSAQMRDLRCLKTCFPLTTTQYNLKIPRSVIVFRLKPFQQSRWEVLSPSFHQFSSICNLPESCILLTAEPKKCDGPYSGQKTATIALTTTLALFRHLDAKARLGLARWTSFDRLCRGVYTTYWYVPT